jgi:hypothetical protein
MDAERQARASADLVTCWWRVGRRNGRVVYALRGDVATDDDPMIGTFDTPALAFEAVRAHNTLLGRSA